MKGITAHVLDTTRGKPASALAVSLARLEDDGSARALASQLTDEDGRVRDLTRDVGLHAGTYRLTFDTGAYFAEQAQPTFYPYVEVVFRVADETQHHHVPLLISPFGYSTYRGS